MSNYGIAKYSEVKQFGCAWNSITRQYMRICQMCTLILNGLWILYTIVELRIKHRLSSFTVVVIK